MTTSAAHDHRVAPRAAAQTAAPKPHEFAPPLDQAMAEMRAEDPRPWGWQPVLLPLATLTALVAIGNVVTRMIHPVGFDTKLALAATINLSAEALLAVSVWVAGRGVAARYGGWGPSFGWRAPQWKDVGYAAAGVGITFLARIAVSAVANLATHGQATKQAQNVHLHTTSCAVVSLLVFLTVLCAPPIEEAMFRGRVCCTDR